MRPLVLVGALAICGPTPTAPAISEVPPGPLPACIITPNGYEPPAGHDACNPALARPPAPAPEAPTSAECEAFYRARAQLEAEISRDAEAAYEARRAELQSTDREFFEGRVNYRTARGEPFAQAIVGAFEDLHYRNDAGWDGRSANAFTRKVGCPR